MNTVKSYIRGLAIGLLVLLPGAGWAAPVNGVFTYHQPDGSSLSVRVVGDEFFAEEETLDGRHIIQDPVSKYWCYARLSEDGNSLESTGVVATGNERHAAFAEGLPEYLRLKTPREHRKRIDQANRERLGRDARGRLKASRSPIEASFAASGGAAQNEILPVVSETTLGTKKGLTLLIRFSDRAADVTITRVQVTNYCNQTATHYTEFGNNGSVAEYFSDVSNAKLNYTNSVADYYTAKYTRSYYTDEAINYGTRAQELIKEALNALEASSFDFRTVDADSDGVVDALNCFYAGATVNAWAKGLWPHASSLSWTSAKTGIRTGAYQITNMGQTLVLGTFCHENGHMLCDFPDVYDYDYDSSGGAGRFCLMNSGGSGTNPCAPNAYLRYKAGWAAAETIPASANISRTLTAESSGRLANQFLIYFNPANSKEYFILENRYKNDRDSGLPTGGIAVWHVDEQGNHNNQSYAHQSSHANFEVALIQADNQRHLERETNSGDANDLFHAGNLAAGYLNEFSDTSDSGSYDNNAHWWNGSPSGLKLSGFSGLGNAMSLIVGQSTMGVSISPASVTISTGATRQFTATVTGTSNTAVTWSCTGGTVSASGLYTAPATAGTYTVKATSVANTSKSASATVTVTGTSTSTELLVNGTFENATTGWSGNTGDIGNWSSYGKPAYAGTRCCWICGVGKTTTENVYQTVTIPSNATSATLSFYLRIDTAETANVVYDKLTVTLMNSSNVVLKTLATYSNLNKTTGYVLKTFDVSAYKGQTLKLNFKGTEDASLQTSFLVDNVSLIKK